MEKLESALALALRGIPVSIDDAMELDATATTDQLCDAADRIRRERCGNYIDTCSIVNARSGHCSEDCKWCAQSARHHTGVEVYDEVGEDTLDAITDAAYRHGVQRLSLVTSGRRVPARDIERFAMLYRRIARRAPGLKLCASMGLLDEAALSQLRAEGVTRYHCNLETAASFFPSLCTTHTHADKLATIRAARRAGMQVCVGGIIGMGETMRQRLELAAEARDAGAVSMPVNLLHPIPGTPMEGTPLLDEDTVARSIALMRFVAPDLAIRFAGGRARLTPEGTRRILNGGLNGIMIGDLLTTSGNDAAADFNLLHAEGFSTVAN